MEAEQERGDFFIVKTEGEEDSIKWVSSPTGRLLRFKGTERTFYMTSHDPFDNEETEIRKE
jgi:hypothetical protein